MQPQEQNGPRQIVERISVHEHPRMKHMQMQGQVLRVSPPGASRPISAEEYNRLVDEGVIQPQEQPPGDEGLEPAEGQAGAYGVVQAGSEQQANALTQGNRQVIDDLHEYEEDICARIARTLAEANRTLEWSNIPKPDTSHITAEGPISPPQYTQATQM